MFNGKVIIGVFAALTGYGLLVGSEYSDEKERCAREDESQRVEANSKQVKKKPIAINDSPKNSGSRSRDPREIFKTGAVIESSQFMKLVDDNFPGARFLHNQTIEVVYDSKIYVIRSKKINDTDVPANYKVLSVSEKK